MGQFDDLMKMALSQNKQIEMSQKKSLEQKRVEQKRKELSEEEKKNNLKAAMKAAQELSTRLEPGHSKTSSRSSSPGIARKPSKQVVEPTKKKATQLSFRELMQESRKVDQESLRLIPKTSSDTNEKQRVRSHSDEYDHRQNGLSTKRSQHDRERTTSNSHPEPMLKKLKQDSTSPLFIKKNKPIVKESPVKSSLISKPRPNPSYTMPKHSLFKSKKGKAVIPNDLVALNTKKRDLRTVDEIQEEIKQRKLGIEKTQKTSNQEYISSNQKRKSASLPPSSKLTTSLHSSTMKKYPESHLKEKTSAHSPPSKQKISSSSRDKIVHRPPSSKKLDLEEALKDEKYVSTNYSSIIGQLFGYDRRRYGNDSDDSDMEAGFEDVRKEEARSTRIAKKEDAREEALEKMRLEKKMKK